MSKTKKAYAEILKLLNKYKTDITFDVDYLEKQAKNHLFGIKLVEEHGFNLEPKSINSTDYQSLKDNVCIAFYDGVKRRVSWSDDGKQPDNEMLLDISFPTGAYFFGRDYPTEFFNKFFEELKKYNPKYTNSTNHCLYFSLDNAGKIFNDYDGIKKRFIEENKADIKQRKIKKMKEELSRLESES